MCSQDSLVADTASASSVQEAAAHQTLERNLPVDLLRHIFTMTPTPYALWISKSTCVCTWTKQQLGLWVKFWHEELHQSPSEQAPGVMITKAIKHGTPAACCVLLAHAVAPRLQYDMASYALQKAARLGKVDVCAALLYYMVNTALEDLHSEQQKCNKHGETATKSESYYKDPNPFCLALLEASGRGHVDVCRLLLSTGLVHADSHDSVALLLAAATGSYEVCQLLLQQEVRPARANAQNHQALVYAARYGHLLICNYLLTQREHAARADARGCEALVEAAAFGHYHVCQLLLTQDEHPARANAEDSVALAAAAARGCVATCAVLLSQPRHAANGRAEDSLALVEAVRQNHLKVAKLLLQHSGRPAHAGARDQDCIDIAIGNKNMRMCRLLLRHL